MAPESERYPTRNLPSKGYVLRGKDGSLYLIRDEILEACKMEGPDLEFARDQDARVEEEGVEKFRISEGPFSEFARIDYKQAPRWQNEVADTVMCGW
jgi:hypothetical protein